ncbi:MAG: sugar ABC transporter substrate-binding protein [Actinobacteria bacterium]|nr:sugar ABC transporter substrate-binding protein [Actinomycetota bacterium]
MYKKFLSIIVSILAIIGTMVLLGSCSTAAVTATTNTTKEITSQAETSQAEKVTPTEETAKPAIKGKITVLVDTDTAGKNFEEYAKEFTAKTGVQVELAIVSFDDLVNKLGTALPAGDSTYDIVTTMRRHINQFAPGGYLEPLDAKLTQDEKKAYMPELIDNFTALDGKLYALPILASWTIFFYNKEMFKEAGLDPDKPPQTIDEEIEYGKKLTKDLNNDGIIDQWGYTDSLKYINAFVRWFGAFGEKIWEIRDGKPYLTINSPQAAEALQTMIDFMDKYKIAAPDIVTNEQQQAAQLFSQGRAAMFNNWDMMLLVINDPASSKVAGKVGYSIMPGVTKDLSGSFPGHTGFSIPVASKNKDAALEFAKFISSKDIQEKRLFEEGMTPAVLDLFNDPAVIKKAPQLPVVLEASKHQIMDAPAVEWSKITDIIIEQCQLALVGKESPKDALDSIASEGNKLLGW